MKKLRRNRSDATFAGVLGGLGEYFGVDPVLLRVFFVLLVFVTGVFPGVIAYLLAILIIPLESGPKVYTVNEEKTSQ